MILFLTFYEASAKKWKKCSIALQCKDCDTKLASNCSYFKLVIPWYFKKGMVTPVRFHCGDSFMLLQNQFFLSIHLSFQDQLNFKLSVSTDKSSLKLLWTELTICSQRTIHDATIIWSISTGHKSHDALTILAFLDLFWFWTNNCIYAACLSLKRCIKRS